MKEIPKNNVGIAMAGTQENCYIHVEKYTEDAWLLYWVNPEIDIIVARAGVDYGDDLLGSEDNALDVLNEYLKVKWMNDSEASKMYRRYFDFSPSEADATTDHEV